MDFIIITFTSSRSILPASSIGSTVHHPEYVANPIFELSSINPPQIYVRTIMWMKLPTMWKKKMRRIEIGTFACVHNSGNEILLNVFLIFEFLISREKLKLIKTSLLSIRTRNISYVSKHISKLNTTTWAKIGNV